VNDPALTVIALLIAGYLLLAVEAFVIPGFGVAGIGGLLCLGVGCYLAYQQFGPASGTLAVVVVLGSVTAAMWWIPKTRVGKDVVLSSTLEKSKASTADIVAGTVGVADSDLRPAGVARFGERRESVVTEGEYIGSGQGILVTQVRGSRLVVELAPAEPPEKAEAT